jgi:hypothetical protein
VAGSATSCVAAGELVAFFDHPVFTDDGGRFRWDHRRVLVKG